MKREEIIQKQYDNLAPKLLKELGLRGYDAFYCEDKKQAAKKALSLIPKNASVTWGGSVTLDETGLKDVLRKGDYQVIDRDAAKTDEERVKLMHQAFTCDVYLSSVNAMSESGEMINIDGNCNRIAAIAYGPEMVILLVGMNKVCKDLESAKNRARNFAAPCNGIRLGVKLPCTKTGSCADCQSADSMCSQIVEMRRNRIKGRIKVILIGEDLGL